MSTVVTATEHQAGLSQESLVEAIRAVVSRRQFEFWFSSLRLVVAGAGKIVLSVPDAFVRDWLGSYYRDLLERVVADVAGSPLEIELTVAEDDPLRVAPRPPVAVAHGVPAPSPADLASSNASYFSKHSDVALNLRYSFETFVSGPNNRLALAAARAVADAPASSYNPLFLHGGVGMGKTHLLQAICRRALESGRRVNVLYLSSETFVNQFISAVEHGELDRFRYKYRNVDMLLVDDIHLIANKERTQEEFFHTFNALFHAGRQIVLSSDSPPEEIPTLKERLVSRFKWGMEAEIAPPGYETRLAILRRKAADRSVLVPEEVVAWLADEIDTNIRELEGAVTKVIGYAEIVQRPLDLDVARQALGHLPHDPTRGVTGVDRILEVVCKHFDLRVADLQGRKRTQSVALPRQVAMFLTRKLTPLSLEEIGGHFGGRDHSTVLYAIERVRERGEQDDSFRKVVDSLLARVHR